MKDTPSASKDDVLHAFSVETNPTVDTLASYLERYPEFRESLIDLSIELHEAQHLNDVDKVSIPSEQTQLAWSKFQSMLKSTDPASKTSSTAGNPLSNLSSGRFRQLAKDIGVNGLFLSRLRDCSILISTIPLRFLVKVAEELDMSVEDLQTTLQAPPKVASGLRFKSDSKPSADKQMTFEEAVEQSNLSEEQKSALRAFKE